MVTPGVSGGESHDNGSNGTNSSAPEANQAALIASQLFELKEMCSVLGMSYSGKLKDFGIKEGLDVTSESQLWLAETLITLRKIRHSRFTELKGHCNKVIHLWSTSFRALSKGIDLNQLYAVADAKRAADIKSEKLLSPNWIDQVKLEIDRFESAEETKLKDKYKARKKKLVDLMKLSHLAPIDVGFDPSEPVAPKMYKDAANTIKAKIKEVEPMFLERKKLVFRVEQVHTAINERQSSTTIDALVERAKEAAEDIMPDNRVLRYDGLDILVVLGNLWSMACSLREDFDEELRRNTEAASTRTRTRSGVGTQDTAKSRQPGNKNRDVLADWMTKDTKKISYFAFNVANLEHTKKCYIDCFGMTVLRECQQDNRSYMFLGFEPEKTALQLIYEPGEDLDVGQGFGHISLTTSDVRKVAKMIESSPFCKIVNKPCRLEGCSTVVAFASDVNQMLFEVIQSTAKLEPICRLVLYATNIDQSVLFYQKALGMRVLKKKADKTYEMVSLAFGDEDKTTVLELRTSSDDKAFDSGNVYCKMVIETSDVLRSYEFLKKFSEQAGGVVLEEPTAEKKICYFEDPDGWKGVLVEQADPDKDRHIL